MEKINIILISVLMLLIQSKTTFSQTGNVGIGTNDPQSKLHVAGDMLIDDQLEFKNTNGLTLFKIDPNEEQFEMFNAQGERDFILQLGSSSNFTNSGNSSESLLNNNSQIFFGSGSLSVGLDRFGIEISNENKSTNLNSFGLDVKFNNSETSYGASGIEFIEGDESFELSVDVLEKKLILEGGLCVEQLKIEDPESGKSTTITSCENKMENLTSGESSSISEREIALASTDGCENTSTSNSNRVEDTNSGEYSQMDKEKVISGNGSSTSQIDSFGFFNLTGGNGNPLGTSFGPSGVFQFNNENSIGFIFDLINENMQFLSDVNVSGEISANVKNFRIDHPLDPYNKILQHVSIESPDMKNIYDGVISTNGMGKAIVQLPAYFEALNMEFRYQLTVIGSFAQAIISEEIQNNQFEIQTNEPNIKVSWQVTGIRHDTYANAERVQVELEKKGNQKGKLLYQSGKKVETSPALKKKLEQGLEEIKIN